MYLFRKMYLFLVGTIPLFAARQVTGFIRCAEHEISTNSKTCFEILTTNLHLNHILVMRSTVELLTFNRI